MTGLEEMGSIYPHLLSFLKESNKGNLSWVVLNNKKPNIYKRNFVTLEQNTAEICGLVYPALEEEARGNYGGLIILADTFV